MIHPTLEQQTQQKSLRKLLLVIGSAACLLQAQAQTPVKGSPGRPVSSSSTYSTLRDTGKVIDVREKLVQLALQNPNFEIADRNVAIANDQLKKTKAGWLGMVTAQGNLNEFSIHPPTVNGQAVNLYPRYNVGVNIPFDIFGTKSNDIKIAKQQIGIAQAQKNERFREIKAEVLTKYEDYLLFKTKLEFQSQVVQDAESVYLQAEKDFSEGIIKQEDYNKAFKARSEEKAKMAEIVHSYNVTKIEMEKLIGVPIESVINNQ